MRISDWSSDVFSSDLTRYPVSILADPILDQDDDSDHLGRPDTVDAVATRQEIIDRLKWDGEFFIEFHLADELTSPVPRLHVEVWGLLTSTAMQRVLLAIRSEEHTSELQSLMRISYAVLCLKKKTKPTINYNKSTQN